MWHSTTDPVVNLPRPHPPPHPPTPHPQPRNLPTHSRDIRRKQAVATRNPGRKFLDFGFEADVLVGKGGSACVQRGAAGARRAALPLRRRAACFRQARSTRCRQLTLHFEQNNKFDRLRLSTCVRQGKNVQAQLDRAEVPAGVSRRRGPQRRWKRRDGEVKPVLDGILAHPHALWQRSGGHGEKEQRQDMARASRCWAPKLDRSLVRVHAARPSQKPPQLTSRPAPNCHRKQGRRGEPPGRHLTGMCAFCSLVRPGCCTLQVGS